MFTALSCKGWIKSSVNELAAIPVTLQRRAFFPRLLLLLDNPLFSLASLPFVSALNSSDHTFHTIFVVNEAKRLPVIIELLLSGPWVIFHFVWQLARLPFFYLPLRLRLILEVFPKSIWQIIFSGKERPLPNIFSLALSLCLNVLLFCFVLNTCALPPSTNSRVKNVNWWKCTQNCSRVIE